MDIVEQEMDNPLNRPFLAEMEREVPLFYEHDVRVAHLAEVSTYFMDLQAYKRPVVIASLLHDIGKIKHPEIYRAVHRPLTAQERAIVKQHPRDGFEMLEGVHDLLVRIPVVGHQECTRWDPYPRSSSDQYEGTRTPKPLATLLTQLIACADQVDRVLRPLRGEAPSTMEGIERRLREGYLGPEECVQATLSAVVCGRLSRWV